MCYNRGNFLGDIKPIFTFGYSNENVSSPVIGALYMRRLESLLVMQLLVQCADV